MTVRVRRSVYALPDGDPTLDFYRDAVAILQQSSVAVLNQNVSGTASAVTQVEVTTALNSGVVTSAAAAQVAVQAAGDADEQALKTP